MAALTERVMRKYTSAIQVYMETSSSYGYRFVDRVVKFHTRMALRKLLAGQSQMEKKLMTKLQGRLQLLGHALHRIKIPVIVVSHPAYSAPAFKYMFTLEITINDGEWWLNHRLVYISTVKSACLCCEECNSWCEACNN